MGAAIAASVATAGCSSPTVVHNADEVQQVTVDMNKTQVNANNTQTEQTKKEPLEVAADPNPTENTVVASDPDTTQKVDPLVARREKARREAEERRLQQQMEQEMEQRDRWRNRHPCTNGVCPPYGCVFPDESCDVLRV